jgi:uncharacterized protein involved in response to NO
MRDASQPTGLLPCLADEGFRLFFPLSALYAALWPQVWVLAFGFDLPLAQTVPPSLWHAHEMLVGAFGAALIGFITTAVPEWTDTPRLRGRALWLFAALWGLGRCIGAFGWEGPGVIGALADLAWLGGLLVCVLSVSWNRRTERLLAFAFWLATALLCLGIARAGFLLGDIALATRAIHLLGFAFLGLLGLALAHITVPVTNLILDPSEKTAPFRPHPGRMNLAPGLVLLAMVGLAAGLSDAITAYLLIAAGAAFMDRLAEHFIGRSALRAEVLMLAGASAMAGAGLLMAGAALLGAPWSFVAAMHVAFLGGLGLGVYAVFCIAGLLHAHQPLGIPLAARIGALLLCVSVPVRVAPDLGMTIPGSLHAVASILWAAAFFIWLATYWPFLSSLAPKGRPGDAMDDPAGHVANALLAQSASVGSNITGRNPNLDRVKS